jgi:hypothetical protein
MTEPEYSAEECSEGFHEFCSGEYGHQGITWSCLCDCHESPESSESYKEWIQRLSAEFFKLIEYEHLVRQANDLDLKKEN